jgi:hypothetical protein
VTWFSARIDEPKLRYIAATCASDGSIWIVGSSASGGRSPRTWITRVVMSASARAASKFSSRRTLIVDSPCTLCDSM